MKVVRIVKPRNTDTVAALEYLLEQARKQEVSGMALVYRPPEAKGQVVITGCYKTGSEVYKAATMMFWKLHELDERGPNSLASRP
jgi:hypothetical protein